ncbi:MAG TPA: SpoIVB peptidase S55 domain-containing protein [Polyangiaceae bacterium]
MRTKNLPLVSALVGLAAGLGLSIPLARGDSKLATISVGEIKEGMKGYGLTVFHGTEPERFDVEVLGILHNFRPAQDLILVKTPHPRLDITKNVRGMSGSPIFLDGRLAGAYAYSYTTFPTEAVAGVTPIAPMLTELHRPIPPGFWPIEGGPPLPHAPPAPGEPMRPTSFLGEPGSYDVEAHAAQLAKRMAVDPALGITRNATPLLVSGVGERTAAYLRELVEPLGFETLQGGGGQGPAAGAPAHFVDGGALGIQFVSGDISMLGLGTVTHVEGTKLCGFGHPMFEAGNVAMPASIGRVLWIYASINHSVKIGEIARPLGALVNDRQSAVVVDEAKQAPTFPMTMTVKGVVGAPKTTWNTIVAQERFMSASLTATVIGSVVEATVSEHRDLTWKLDSKVHVRGHGVVEVEDFGVAIGGMPEAGDFARARVARTVGDVMNNPWEMVAVESVESTLSVEYKRDLWRLRGVDALEDTVDAGGTARVVLHLVPFVGKEILKTLDVKIPAELAGKDADIEVLPGYEVTPELAAPEDLPELLANEGRQFPSRSMVIQVRVPAEGVTYHGHVATRLPPFALDALRPAHSDVGPEPFNSYVRTTVPLDQYVEGHDHVKVKVRAVMR